MKYAISITETTSRIVIIEATNSDDAQDIAQKMWANCDVVLDSGDFQDVECQYEPDYVINECEGN